ncbi:MAG TPA: 4-hydroxythreonine-4-phosphate dehydrogenase PdxA [Polyangiaceae bacterium]
MAAAARLRGVACVLVGDEATLLEAADLMDVPRRRFARFDGEIRGKQRLYIQHSGPKLAASDRRPGKPSRKAGVAQLAYIDAAYQLTARAAGRALVTGPVSKAAIAHSGERRARAFLGHTEWLRDLDGARSSVMCFAASKLVTSVVTTHVPLSRVPERVTAAGVAEATYWLGRLLLALGYRRPEIAVCSLNPHAGESELLGTEEKTAILPGMRRAAKQLGTEARVVGPVGAESAYRKALAGDYAGVVAMYHDQATIPMKLVAFGEAVNITMGLSIVRTSVDHGTAYDIAWRGVADVKGMSSALNLAARLAGAKPLS